jgi:hypothetical protein
MVSCRKVPAKEQAHMNELRRPGVCHQSPGMLGGDSTARATAFTRGPSRLRTISRGCALSHEAAAPAPPGSTVHRVARRSAPGLFVRPRFTSCGRSHPGRPRSGDSQAPSGPRPCPVPGRTLALPPGTVTHACEGAGAAAVKAGSKPTESQARRGRPAPGQGDFAGPALPRSQRPEETEGGVRLCMKSVKIRFCTEEDPGEIRK